MIRTDTTTEQRAAKTADHQAIVRLVPLVEHAGLVIEHLSRGEARLRLPFEGNTNHLDIMYAGSLFMIAEFAGGVVCTSSLPLERFAPIVKRLDIQFRRPATSDVTVTATLDDAEIRRVVAEAEEHGKVNFPIAVEIRDADGTVVAVTVAEYQLRRT